MTHPAYQPVPVHSDIDRLASEITPLAGQIDSTNHRLLKLITEFDQRKGWSDAGALLAKAIETIVAPIQAEEQSQKRVSAETREVPFEVNECFRYQALLEHSRADALSAITEQFPAADWACGANLVPVPEYKRGNVLNIDSRSRTFPQKRAPPRCATLRGMVYNLRVPETARPQGGVPAQQ